MKRNTPDAPDVDRAHEFIKVYNWMYYLDVSPLQREVFALIYSYCKNGETGMCFATQNNIAKRMQQAESNVSRLIKGLEVKGLLVRYRPGDGSCEFVARIPEDIRRTFKIEM